MGKIAEAILPTLRKYGVEQYALGSAVLEESQAPSNLDILLFVEEGGLHSVKAVALAEAEALLGEVACLFDIKNIRRKAATRLASKKRR